MNHEEQKALARQDMAQAAGTVTRWGKVAGHVFISYVREDSDRVDRLQRTLQAAGIPVWRDTVDLWPGEDWRVKIRRAITDSALVFIACFSRASLARGKSYQNEELTLAIEQLRLRNPDDPWLIPVRFDDCDIPDRDIGGGRMLTSIQRADLFGDRFDDGAARLAAAVRRILGQPVQGGRVHSRPKNLQSSRARFDAILIPTCRPVTRLRSCIGLARRTQTPLIVACSRAASQSEVIGMAGSANVEAFAFDLPPGNPLGIGFTTSADKELSAASPGWHSDLSMKRNLGLVLARLLGWTRLMFLDDDIYGVRQHDVAALAAALDDHAVSALIPKQFPDNSVVTHANRLIGERQDVFASGSGMGVRCDRDDLAFFPDIYGHRSRRIPSKHSLITESGIGSYGTT
jgi:TIR domain